MWARAMWCVRVLTGILSCGVVLQTGCVLGKQETEALISSGITSAIQIIVNSVFFALDSFFVSIT